MNYPRGTRLTVTTLPDLGVVTYWRAGTEISERVHVVYCENLDNCRKRQPGFEKDGNYIGHWIQGTSLVLAH